MLRKTIIAVIAAASVGMLAPTVALARGGGGGGGGGGHGGGGGGSSTPAAALVAAASMAAVLVEAVSTLVVLAAQPLLAVADFTAERRQVADSMAVASTMGFTTGAALEATATTPLITATTTTDIRTMPTAIPTTTMATATWCSGACIRAPVGTLARSRSAADPAGFDG
jgi:hypothetical protein